MIPVSFTARLGLLLWLVAGIPASGAADRNPNVLFIVSDDLNTDLGCYGHQLVQSPHIDRLAKRGLRFENAYCQYPVCNPSRSSFMTGRYPDQTGVLSNQGNFREKLPEIQTMPQWFRQHGYFVARVGKIFHYGVPDQIGTDGEDDAASWDQKVNPRGLDREVHHLIQSLEPGKFGGTLSWLNLPSEDEQHTDAKGAAAAIGLMEEHHPDKTGKPFFLAVGFYRPHTPYVAPSPWFEKYPRDGIEPLMEREGDRDDIPVAALADRPKQRELTVEQRQEIIQAYYASVSFMDAQVGRLLDALQRLKLEDNTVVVFVSDHGYHLGHHGLWQKGDLFEGSAHVPFILAPPRYPLAGQSTQALAEMVDLYPTLAALCGLPKPGVLPGKDLGPVLHDPRTMVRTTALTEAWSRAARLHPEMRGKQVLGYSIRTSRYRYTEWGEAGAEGIELYDYQADPMEWTNLARVDGNEKIVDKMRKLMGQARKQAGAPAGKR